MPILTERERLGTRLAGKYTLTAVLGRGGMGTVFAGTHEWTGRRVAVKLLKPSFAEDANVVRRFLREARAAASIRHPHVVDVLDMGQESDGTVYMVLELLEGESLGALVARRGSLPPEELLPIALPIADVLVEVHAAGLVHRDLKPDNIYVATRRGRTVPKLLDFGIAKILEDTQQSHATRTGAIIGTPHYMSPEQASGSKHIGAASDVWSLGVVLYECLTGELPFDANTAAAVLVRILTAPAPRLAQRGGIPRGLAQVVDRAMQPELAARYPDMRAMRDALRDVAQELGIAIPDTLADEDVVAMSEGELAGAGAPLVLDEPSPEERAALESAPTMASEGPPSRGTPGVVSRAERAPSRWIGRAAAVVAALVVLAIGLAIGRGTSAPEPSVSSERADDDAAIVPDAAVAAPVAPRSTSVVASSEADTDTDTDTETDPSAIPIERTAEAEWLPPHPAGARPAPMTRPARAASTHRAGERAPSAGSVAEEPSTSSEASTSRAASEDGERSSTRGASDDDAPRRPGVREQW